MPPEPAGGEALAVFDLDGTITRHDTLLPFLLACLRRWPWRLPRLLWALPLLCGFLVHRDRGRFKGGLIHAILGGLPRAALQDCAACFVPQVLHSGLYAEALQAIEQHRRRGDRLVLMSASTDLYVPLIGQLLGFSQTLCTQVRWRPDGRLDGRLATANCRGEEKRRCLEALLAQARPARLYAYGNSREDLLHMRLAQQGWFVNGNPRLLRDCPGIEAVRWSRHAAP